MRRIFFNITLMLSFNGCATTTLYRDEFVSTNKSHVLITGIQNVLVSDGKYFLINNDKAYALDCSNEDYLLANRLTIYLDINSNLPNVYQLNYDDKYLYFGRLTLSKYPDLFSYDTIYSEVVSIKFDKIKPKSIYFKLAMTPFAIAFDAALCGGFSTGSIASDPAAVVSILNAVSK